MMVQHKSNIVTSSYNNGRHPIAHAWTGPRVQPINTIDDRVSRKLSVCAHALLPTNYDYVARIKRVNSSTREVTPCIGNEARSGYGTFLPAVIPRATLSLWLLYKECYQLAWPEVAIATS